MGEAGTARFGLRGRISASGDARELYTQSTMTRSSPQARVDPRQRGWNLHPLKHQRRAARSRESSIFNGMLSMVVNFLLSINGIKAKFHLELPKSVNC